MNNVIVGKSYTVKDWEFLIEKNICGLDTKGNAMLPSIKFTTEDSVTYEIKSFFAVMSAREVLKKTNKIEFYMNKNVMKAKESEV